MPDDRLRSARASGCERACAEIGSSSLQTREKRFFLSSIFLAKHKKDTGPSAASASPWLDDIQTSGRRDAGPYMLHRNLAEIRRRAGQARPLPFLPKCHCCEGDALFLNTSVSTKHNYPMDIARITACFMVITMHVTAAWKYGEYGTFEWNTAILYDCFCRSAVPIFFMLSGAFFKKKTLLQSVKGIVKFTAIFFLSSLVYALNDLLITNAKFSLEAIINGIIKYKYHLWFLPSYILVLSVAPIIIRALDSEDKNEVFKYALIVWFILCIIIHSVRICVDAFEKYAIIHQFLGLIEQLTFFAGNHIGYFVLGRYLMQVKLSKKAGITAYFAGAISTIALFVLTIVYSRIKGSIDERWFSTLNVFVVLQAVGCFLFIKNRSGHCWRFIQSICEKIRKMVFGVYLTHVFFLEWFYKLGIFRDNCIGKIKITPLIGIPIRVMIIFCCSFCIGLLFNKMKDLCRTIFIIRK